VRGLAEAAGVAASTVHRIEQGAMQPTVDTLARIAEAAGTRVHLEARPDYAASVVGLAHEIRRALESHDLRDVVRMAAELSHRFLVADHDTRRRVVTARPPSTGDPQWDAFLGALAEWLASKGGVPVTAWARRPERYLDHGWWITPMESMRAWEFAGSPMAFKQRGVYLHRESLANT